MCENGKVFCIFRVLDHHARVSEFLHNGSWIQGGVEAVNPAGKKNAQKVERGNMLKNDWEARACFVGSALRSSPDCIRAVKPEKKETAKQIE